MNTALIVITIVVLVFGGLYAAYRIVAGYEPYDDGWDPDDDQWHAQDNPDPVSYMPAEVNMAMRQQAMQRDAFNFNPEGMRSQAQYAAEQAVRDAAARGRAAPGPF